MRRRATSPAVTRTARRGARLLRALLASALLALALVPLLSITRSTPARPLQRPRGQLPAAEPDGLPRGVPHILHHMHASITAANAHQRLLMLTCTSMHPTWRRLFWNDSSVDAFVAATYPEYYPFWSSLHPPIKRIDSSRYMILHHFGGVYVDIDVECITPLDSLVDALPAGAAWTGGWPDPMFMISTPGNLFWLEMMARARRTASSENFGLDTGPGGLKRAQVEWLQRHGDGALERFVTRRGPGDALSPNFTAFLGADGNNSIPWYGAPYIHDTLQKNATWVAPHRQAPPEYRLGFLPNQLIDPGSCKEHHCGQLTCAHAFPDAYVYHHCLSSWKDRLDGGVAYGTHDPSHPKFWPPGSVPPGEEAARLARAAALAAQREAARQAQTGQQAG